MNDNDSQSSIPHPDIEETIDPVSFQNVIKKVDETELFTLHSNPEELVRQINIKTIPIQKDSTQIIDGILPVCEIVDNKMDDLEFFENVIQGRESIDSIDSNYPDNEEHLSPVTKSIESTDKVDEESIDNQKFFNPITKTITDTLENKCLDEQESSSPVTKRFQSIYNQYPLSPKLPTITDQVDEPIHFNNDVLVYDYQPVFSDATFNPIVVKGSSDNTAKLRLIDPNFIPIQAASNLFVPYFTDITSVEYSYKESIKSLDSKTEIVDETNVGLKESEVISESIDYGQILSKESVDDNTHLNIAEDAKSIDPSIISPVIDEINEKQLKIGDLKPQFLDTIEDVADDEKSLGAPILVMQMEKKLPLWMPRPARPTHCPYGLEYLNEVSKLQVQQTLYHVGHLSQVCFMVKNNNGQRVYNVHSDTCYFMKFLCASRRRFEFRVLDEDNREIIHLSRPRRLEDQRRYLQIHAPVDEALGKITKEINIPEFTILDASDEALFRIEIHSEPTTNKKLTFAVLSMNEDNHVANISPEYLHLSKKIFHSNVLNIEYFSSLDAKLKALILGAAFLIDLIYFELF